MNNEKKVKNEDGDNWFLIECKRYYYTTVVKRKRQPLYKKVATEAIKMFLTGIINDNIQAF